MGVLGNFVITLIAGIGGFVLGAVVLLFQSMQVALPTQIIQAANDVSQYFAVANGILPIPLMIPPVLMIVLVWKFKYAVLIFLHTIFPFIPVVGKKVDLPDMKRDNKR